MAPLVVIGAGYVGLVTAAGFANLGHDVVCVDNDSKKIEDLNAGNIPFFEPSLPELVAKTVKQGTLTFSNYNTQAIMQASVIMITIPAGNPIESDKQYQELLTLVSTIAIDSAQESTYTGPNKTNNPKKIIAIKSTVPPGTCESISSIIKKVRTDKPMSIASMPEFLSEGHAISNFFSPQRVVIGTNDNLTYGTLKALYDNLSSSPIFIKTTPRTAELSKYACNVMLASRVTLINDLARLCETSGCNIDDLTAVMASDDRIGSKFLSPGPGFGGSCFPKDLNMLLKYADETKASLPIFAAVASRNQEHQTDHLINMLQMPEFQSKGKTIACFGAAFKANTDDIRESPILHTIRAVRQHGHNIAIYDPKATKPLQSFVNETFNETHNIQIKNDPYEAVSGADALIVLTEWDIFKTLDYKKIKQLMNGSILLDLRRILDTDDMVSQGFKFRKLGDPSGC